MYRVIETSTWDDPKVKKLDVEGRLLFLYLITNRHAHVAGIYYISRDEIARESGLAIRHLDTLCHTLNGLGLCRFDTENDLVWVKNMLKKQGKGPKISRSVAKHLATLHYSLLLQEFLAYYASYKIPYTIPLPAQDLTIVQEQEQDQKQYQEQEQEKQQCVVPENNNAFDVFWKAWPRHPRKVAKAACAEWWKNHGLDQKSEAVMVGLAACKKSEMWTKEAGRFIPLPSTWLHQRRWEDDVKDILAQADPEGVPPARNATEEELAQCFAEMEEAEAEGKP